ncbi:hypothetical protein [Pseudochrobactrum sp. XF203]|uniref:hypothetical protein n=1 Tax=Pseudochrobactrum sp. XF203 TaxID=2879116 RepID=UPI001CE2F1FC|nr:hypothetical protein [Pseudochrobactrum sp. XF203]UCA44929.1 hypothetical protein LDL70_11215 [Pseudochrobactrum sp. XF203]
MYKILYYTVALIFLPSSVMAGNPSENVKKRVLTEFADRSGVSVDDLQLVLVDCELNQRNMNLCAFQRAIQAELLLGDAIKMTGAKTDSDFAAWKKQLQARCHADADKETGGGAILPKIISECKELAMLAKRYTILGAESFPPPPQPPHKWD